MTQKDKQLLIKDLCARLPYRVKVVYLATTYSIQYVDSKFDEVKLEGMPHTVGIGHIKPYLRPMSSMTEEEKKEYDTFLFDNLEREDVIGYEDKAFGIDVIMRYRSWEVIQWLLEHRFDFNDLIDLGLALEAPEGMYK